MSKRGATAMRHARAWIESEFRGRPVLQAQQNVVWIKGRGGDRMPMTRTEDLFGCFDFLVLPNEGLIYLVQVTTQGTKRSSTSDRKRKIRAGLEANYPGARHASAKIRLMAWVPRQHFRVWRWVWSKKDWTEDEPISSPLLRQRSQRTSRGTDVPATPLGAGSVGRCGARSRTKKRADQSQSFGL